MPITKGCSLDARGPGWSTMWSGLGIVSGRVWLPYLRQAIFMWYRMTMEFQPDAARCWPASSTAFLLSARIQADPAAGSELEIMSFWSHRVTRSLSLGPWACLLRHPTYDRRLNLGGRPLRQ